MSSSFRTAYAVTRPQAGAVVNGLWVEGTPATVNITASKHPTTGKQRKNIPAGYDVDSAVLLITDTELLVAEPESQNSDFLTLFGDRYDVVNVDPRQNNVIPHYAVTVARPHQ